MTSRVVSILGVALALVVLLVALFWIFQRKLIYLPFGAPDEPRLHGLPEARTITIHTDDGLELGAWFAESPGPSRGSVIVFNGNAGHRGMRAPLARWLVDAGWSVLLFDYRGYGGNPGAPTEQGLFRDARAARSWVDDNAGPGRIVYFGESLGTGVAVAAATENPPDALVLRSPFTSLVDIGRAHYPFLPVRWLLSDRFDSIRRIADLEIPLLIVAGDRDQIVPTELSRRLYDAAPGAGKRLVIVPGADHNDAALHDGRLVVAETLAFLEADAPGSEPVESPTDH
jgi:fermentation-respiration switch protein FrsA (DUF1100 family)